MSSEGFHMKGRKNQTFSPQKHQRQLWQQVVCFQSQSALKPFFFFFIGQFQMREDISQKHSCRRLRSSSAWSSDIKENKSNTDSILTNKYWRYSLVVWGVQRFSPKLVWEVVVTVFTAAYMSNMHVDHTSLPDEVSASSAAKRSTLFTSSADWGCDAFRFLHCEHQWHFLAPWLIFWG